MAIEIEKAPIHLKVALTIKEAAEYSNIGINKIDSMLRNQTAPLFFTLAHTKRLVKRKEFEIFLSEKLVI